MSIFGERLKELRKESELTQKELADKLSISSSAVAMYERGNREPSFEIMEEIADLFNVDMNFLLGKSQERNATQINIKISAGGENEQKESLANVEHQEAVEKAAELFSRLSEEEQQQALTYIEFLLHKR